MATKREQIVPKALEIIKSQPVGIRYKELVKKVQGQFPDTPVNTIHGIVWDLPVQRPKEVYKPARGLFRHLTYRETPDAEVPQPFRPGAKLANEEDFYQPFADWLEGEDECTKAIPLGGNKFGGKWGTPDVLGVYKPQPGDIVEAPVEVISAEIKTNKGDLITAFGQACSYKLFSHKSYLVIPKDSSTEDISRIEALCLIFGLGLILFNANDSKEPQFDIRTRAFKHEPDIFYFNKYMKDKNSEEIKNKLFA